MWQSTVADLILLVHLAFVLFVSAGAVAVLFRPRLAIIHIPCVAYGAAIELVGWVCPLTPLEQSLRRQAGQEGYTGGFIEHYVGDLLYPADWNEIRLWLALGLVGVNAIIYAFIVVRLWRNRRAG